MILHRLYIVKPSVIGDNKWGAGWAWQKLPTVQHFNDLAWLGKYGAQLFIYFDKGFRIMNDCLKDKTITFHCTDGPICRAWCGGRYPNVGGFCWRVEMLSVLFAQGLSLPSRNRPGQDLDLEIHGVYTFVTLYRFEMILGGMPFVTLGYEWIIMDTIWSKVHSYLPLHFTFASKLLWLFLGNWGTVLCKSLYCLQRGFWQIFNFNPWVRPCDHSKSSSQSWPCEKTRRLDDSIHFQYFSNSRPHNQQVI